MNQPASELEGVPLGMSKIHPEHLDPELSVADLLLREEPDDDDDEEEEEEDDNGEEEDDDDEDDDDDEGYSE